MISTLFYFKPRAIRRAVALCLTLLLVQSCVDKSYDWDDMDTTGVFNIPPIMLGDIETIYLGKLSTGDFPGGIPVPGFQVALTDTIIGIFDGDAVKDFFFDGAGTASIEAKTDVVIEEIPDNTRIILYFNVIDYENRRITEIAIPQQELINGKHQDTTIEIASQYMKYMENAKSLEITIVIISDSGTVKIDKEDYISLKSVIVKTGGYHFDL